MASLPEQFEIGDLQVDLGQQRVQRAGADIALPKLSFDLLVALAKAAPNLISLDDLMTQVWANLVVGPETVSQRVKLLRDALGDDAREPRYIAGLRGRGYRLLTPVRPIDLLAPPPPAQPVPSPAPAPAAVTTAAPHPDRRFIAMVLGLALVTALSLLAWRLNWLGRSAGSAVTVVGLPPRTVAVLPFDDLSLNRDNGQLALGLSEMVLHRLGSIKELLVIARSSSFAFSGKQVDAREIGRRLAARYLVEGTVQHVGDQLRVTVQLVDAQSDRQLRSMSFDRRLKDIFDIQDDIAGQVAAALEVQLMGADLNRVDRTRSTSLDAYLGYMRAESLMNRWTVADADHAASELERSIALDPGFALAYAELARAKWLAHWLRTSVTRDGAPLLGLIDKALALDPRLGEAYAIRGNIRTELDPKSAEADFRRGIELAPNYGPGYEMYAEALHDNLGRPKEADAMIERAMLIDPIAPRSYYMKGLYLWQDRDEPEEAQHWMLKALAISPEFPPALARLGMIKWRTGQTAAGIKLLEQAMRIDPQVLWLRSVACAMYLDIGDRAAAGTFAPGSQDNSGIGIMLGAYDRDFSKAGPESRDWTSVTTYYANHVAAMVLAGHDSQRAARALVSLRRQLSIPVGQEDKEIRDDEHIGNLIELGYLLKTRGERAAAGRLGASILRWAGRDESYDGIMHAVGHALSGERDAELASLTTEGQRSHMESWWIVERDPLWDDVRGDLRYRAVQARQQQLAATQRALLETMRRTGEVPRRP